MSGLVDANFAAAGEGEAGKFSPTLFTHIRDGHVFRLEVLQGRGKIVAHQEKFVLVFFVGIVFLKITFFGIMERGLQRRHGEDQPAVTCIHRWKLKRVAEKGPIGFRVFGVDDDVCPIDQA